MTKEEIKEEATKYVDKIAPYWMRAEPEDRESSIEQLAKFAKKILDKSNKLIMTCYCGKPIDLTNPDCVEFNLCKDQADDC